MNILFLSRLFYPHIGGVEKHVLEMSKILVKKGHKVTIVTEHHSPRLKIRENIEGIQVFRIPGLKEQAIRKFKIWKWFLLNINLISNADIVHCHDVFFWYLPFRFLFPIKKVYTTFHGYEGKLPSKKSILVRKLSEKLSLGNICVGEYLKKWYGTKTNFITYGGVNSEPHFDKTTLNNKKLKIKLIGRFEKDIGIHTYKRALTELRNMKIDFELESYGEGIFKKDLRKIGKVYNPTFNISSVIKNADIVFASSYLTILEALINSKIVIAVYENSLKEDYLKKSPFAKFVLICKNYQEVVSITQSSIKEKWKYNAMTKNGFNWAKEQTWDKCVELYLKLWKI